MTIDDIILNLAEKKKRIKTAEITAATGRSRQYVNVVLQKLIAEGKLLKGGTTVDAFYVLPKNARLVTALTHIKKRLKNQNLEEHIVMDQVSTQALFYAGLKDNIKAVFDYAFSEMLNNAIEHSASENIVLELAKNREDLTFVVRDMGVGVFRNVMQKRNLNSELEAIQDLLKGKTTTQPQAHSGEGIFFTSKIADRFSLQSYDYELLVDNIIDDVFVKPLKPRVRGTRVQFDISLASKKHVSDIFKRYQSSPERMDFDKTEVQIKLYTMGTIHVSRSQARRVLAGLNKFKVVILDFDKVPTIGQAFADEIFRVFPSRHPDIELKPVNMNEAVKFMIERVEKPQPNLEL